MNFTAIRGNPVEKAFDVQIKHPVHFSRQQSRVQRVQRLMLACPGRTRTKIQEVGFVDSVQHLDRRRWTILSSSAVTPSGLCRPSALGYTLYARLRSVRSSLQPFGEILEVSLQLLAVVPPRLPVHARRASFFNEK